LRFYEYVCSYKYDEMVLQWSFAETHKKLLPPSWWQFISAIG